MRLKYIGHHDIFPVVFGNKRFIFNRLNNFTLDVSEAVARDMFTLSGHSFTVLPDPVKEEAKEVPFEEETEAKRKPGRPKKHANT